MARVLVRNVSDSAIARLKARARRNRRSLQAELQMIIERDAASDAGDFRNLAMSLRKKLSGRKHSDSTALIRADRRR